jgi:hypothetical protein
MALLGKQVGMSGNEVRLWLAAAFDQSDGERIKKARRGSAGLF